MHLMNPYTGYVNSKEDLIEVIPHFDGNAFGNGFDSRKLIAGSGLNQCTERVVEDSKELPYVEVVKDQAGRWVGVDGGQVASPINWQWNLIQEAKAGRDCSEMLAEANTIPNNWDIREPASIAIRNAACNGHLETCEQLLLAGADVISECTWELPQTPLHGAALSGHGPVVNLLLKAGANPNAVEFDWPGETPLHNAAMGFHTEIGLTLLKHGADPELKNMDGETSLTFARAEGDEVLIEAFSAVIAEKRAAKLESAWSSTQPTKENLVASQAQQPTQALTNGRRPRF